MDGGSLAGIIQAKGGYHVSHEAGQYSTLKRPLDFVVLDSMSAYSGEKMDVQSQTAKEKEIESPTGYLNPAYAHSLSEFGTPRELPRSGGWILERRIPGTPYRDAMGCYPLFVCRDWSQLQNDLNEIDNEIVSLALVADPFAEYHPTILDQTFEDFVIPFKKHFVIDLDIPLAKFVSRHHRRYARKALREIAVEKCEKPVNFIDEWVGLYSHLIERHDIRGISAFSRNSFIEQLSVPGLVMFKAVYQGEIVGMLLWYVQGEVGYYHLGAFNSLGYELRASFALFWHAIEFFSANSLRWLNLGGGAGIRENETDGLGRFKKGWSTGERTAYFCGRIFDCERYAEIMQTKGLSKTDYFPAYRQGEFT
jgi:hypothetical protein